MKMAAYCRVSTEHEEQLSSLENQRGFFAQYAKKCGDTLIGIYADEGISGKSMKKRDAFLRLLSDSAEGLFDYVAVKDISRFARNTSDFLFGIRTLRQNGVDVRFLSGNQTVIGESEFVLTVFAALAQEESANLSKRVIFGKRQNAKKGRVPNLVYGYDRLDAYTLKINEEEGRIIRMIFDRYLSGEGTRTIAAELNAMGIFSKKHAEWQPKTIRRILENPIYSGRLVNNKSTTDDFLAGTRIAIPKSEQFTHSRPELAIISESEFESVQKELARRSALSGAHSTRHIFSSLIRCAACNTNLTARRSGTHVRYRCPSCKAAADESVLTNEIKNYLESLMPDCQVSPMPRPDAALLLKNADALKKRRDKYKEMFLNDAVSMEELKAALSQIECGISLIENELKAPTGGESLNSLIRSHNFSNRDMRALLDKIVVSESGDIEIFFK